MVLHNGTIAEMKTGEGKTLVATLPAYLNALEGKGVHVVTVNDYLARRDSEWMGRLYRFRSEDGAWAGGNASGCCFGRGRRLSRQETGRNRGRSGRQNFSPCRPTEC